MITKITFSRSSYSDTFLASPTKGNYSEKGFPVLRRYIQQELDYLILLNEVLAIAHRFNDNNPNLPVSSIFEKLNIKAPFYTATKKGKQIIHRFNDLRIYEAI